MVGSFLPDTLEVRVTTLERLVLELAKHVSPAAPLSPSFSLMLEDLKQRHPDV